MFQNCENLLKHFLLNLTTLQSSITPPNCPAIVLICLIILSPKLKKRCCSEGGDWESPPHLCLVEKLLVDGTEVFKLLPELHQGILLLADVLLQHLHGHLHFLFHPNLHLQLLLHILRRLNIRSNTNYFRGILGTYKTTSINKLLTNHFSRISSATDQS